LILANNSFAQEFAEFSTDTTSIHQWSTRDNGKLTKQISDQEWLIDGQRMKYGTGTIKVKAKPNRLDTILFRGYRSEKFDTIICDIQAGEKYTFYFNPCCGSFKVRTESSKKFIQGVVSYKLKSKDQSKTYLGTLGEAGILVNTKNSDPLTTHCRSAMSSNIFKISFSQIEPCKDSLDCGESTCLQVIGKEESKSSYGYKVVSRIMESYYMPLKSDPLVVLYDPKKNQITIE